MSGSSVTPRWRAPYRENADVKRTWASCGVAASNQLARRRKWRRSEVSRLDAAFIRLTLASSTPTARTAAARTCWAPDVRSPVAPNHARMSAQSASARPLVRSTPSPPGLAARSRSTSASAVGEAFEQDAAIGSQPVEGGADRGGVAADGLDDRLEVVEQQVLEAEPLVVVEIGPGEHRTDVGVEVGDGGGERLVLQEHGGRRLQQLARVGRGETVRSEGGELDEAVGHGGEQLPRHLACAAGGGEHLLDLTMDADAERRRRVARGLPLVLGDRGDPDLPRADEEVAVGLQVAQALLEGLGREVDAPLDEIVRRPLGEQGAGEQAHDADVVRRLRGPWRTRRAAAGRSRRRHPRWSV